MNTSRVREEAGFTFVELACAMLVLVIGAAVLINHLAVNYSTMRVERDRIFAFSKAQGILAEIQSFVDRGGVESTVDINQFDDGVVSKPTLTIATDESGVVVSPDHVLSGNYQRDGEWVWSRRISVQPFSGVTNRSVRYVTVHIYRRDKEGTERALADLSAVINSTASAFPTTQVFDAYLLAIENIPGWWVYMDTIRPFVESMLTDLESRNPGLEFRTHWITKASFGRNEGYRPFFNEVNDSVQPIPDVYHYPSKMPAGESSIYYYVPDAVKAHISIDGDDVNGYDADVNPHPYALADFFNHAMRYPDELERWQQRVAAVEAREAAIAAAQAAGTPPPEPLTDMSKEPTLRLFLEDLNRDPRKYGNALVLNLHGELLPMPALRNFSDPARAPQVLPNVRVVTHPEELRTLRGLHPAGSGDPVVLRVYAYNDNTATYAGVDRMPVGRYLIIEVEGVDLVDPTTYTTLKPTARLTNLPGGVPLYGSREYATTWLPAKPLYPTGGSGGYNPLIADIYQEMWYHAVRVYPGGGKLPFTRIYLANTPVVCPLDLNGRGLANTERAQLYGMSYIPCPLENPPDFSRDLSTVDYAGPKNTARWRLEISPSVLADGSFRSATGSAYNPSGDVRLKVRTFIYNGSMTTGVMWPAASRSQPDNHSVTYAWWADSPDDVPFTERAQFNGDPRHLPYKDCFRGGLTAVDFPDAYNWYHNDFYDGVVYGSADYPSIDAARLRDRWNSALSCDVPRYMQLLREGLIKSRCVYTTLSGYSDSYLGIGNDIGFDSVNGYPSSIPSDLTPYGGAGAGNVDTIAGERCYVRDSAAASYWCGMPWLGELYPDAAHVAWHTEVLGAMRGNLDAGTAAGQYFQSPVSTASAGSGRQAYGTVVEPYAQRTGSRGCITFFNTGAAGATFDHVVTTGDGALTAVGQELVASGNIEIPATIPVSRPFGLTMGSWPAEEWSYAPYTARSTASLFETFMTHASGVGSGAVKIVDPTGTSAAYVTVNGIDPSVASGSAFISRWSTLALLHTYFAAGDLSNTLRIKQPPRVEILYPNDISELANPSTIDIQFDVSWTRWDGTPYTATGTFGEDEGELEYVIMYSGDGGDEWRYVQDNSLGTPGSRPANAALVLDDSSSGAETYTWTVPSWTFTDGGYHLRIDCYRQGAGMHYAYHRTQIYIQR